MSKVIFITGASKGIGKATALLLSKSHTLILFSRSLDKLSKLESKINDNGGKCLVLCGDVTKEEDVKDAITKSLQAFGKIDVLINNAGIGLFKRVDDFSLEDFVQVINTNLFGAFLTTKYIVPKMISQKSGQIINISSVAGLTGFKYGTVYAASKFALNGFSESLREDVKDYGIAVTILCPGSVRTEFGGSNPSKDNRDFLLEPEDVAHSIEYLVNESETANTKLIELKPRKRLEKR
jgi:short-subunit dehydrogenase